MYSGQVWQDFGDVASGGVDCYTAKRSLLRNMNKQPHDE